MAENCPCCGDNVLLTSSEFANVQAHTLTIELSGEQIDVRIFSGSTEPYGRTLSCSKSGTITVGSYCLPAVDINDDLTFTANVCGNTISAPVTVASQTINADAKAVVEYTTVMKIEDDITIN